MSFWLLVYWIPVSVWPQWSLAIVWRNCYPCQLVSAETFSSFKLQITLPKTTCSWAHTCWWSYIRPCFYTWIGRQCQYLVRICWLVITNVSILIISAIADPPCRKTLPCSPIITQTTVKQLISQFSCDFTGSNDVELVCVGRSGSEPICNASPWMTDDVPCLKRRCRKTEEIHWALSTLSVP